MRLRKVTNFPLNPPPDADKPLDQQVGSHIGKWSSETNNPVLHWLWLYLEALECRSRPTDYDRSERFALYLSFLLYKRVTGESADVTVLLLVAFAEYPPASWLQDYIQQSFRYYFNYLPEDDHKERICLALNKLSFQLPLARCSTKTCSWSCKESTHPPSIRLVQPPFIEWNDDQLINSSLVSALSEDAQQCVTDGQSEEIESAFAMCLVRKPRSSTVHQSLVTSFPLSTAPISDDDSLLSQPMWKELILELQSSWSTDQEFKSKKNSEFITSLADDIRSKLEVCKNLAQQRVDGTWNQLKDFFRPVESDQVGRARYAAGLSCHIAQRTLFPLFSRLEPSDHQKLLIAKLLENHLIFVVYLQKAIRCLEMLDALDAMKKGKDWENCAIRLIGEIEEVHCSIWKPQEYPKWLIFEIESNMMIRRVQAVVAIAMISGDQRILQLNMGEGKTSVICPLVISSLAKSKRQVMRLTLLTSLLETHGQEISVRLGGLLEQRVYYFPCSRKIEFTDALLAKIIGKFNECLEEGGCIVTVPEHRLSLILKFEEICAREVENNDVKSGNQMSDIVQGFLDIFQLHETFLVDLVDESDEILRYKYQLLYAIGAQQPVDGGERRWKVAQEMLKLLRRYANQLSEDNKSLVFKPVEEEKGSSAWPCIRLVDDSCNNQLRESLVQCVLDGTAKELADLSRKLSTARRDCLKKYLMNKQVSIEDFRDSLNEQEMKDIFILRGLLSYEVLHHSLRKRWSVDYG